MTTRHLWLVRHPTVAVESGTCYGRSDVALAGSPVRMAERLRAELPAQVTVLSSPLRRCAELAHALSAAPLFDARLQEIDFGDWEMKRYDDLPRAAIEHWATDEWGFRPPGGESADEMAKRAWKAWQEHSGRLQGDLVLIAHGGPLRVIGGRLLGLERIDWSGIPIPVGGRLILCERSGCWTCEHNITWK